MPYVAALGDIFELTTVSQDSTAPNSQVGLMKTHYIVSVLGATPPTQTQIAIAMDNAQGLAAQMKLWLNNQSLYRGVMVQKIYPIPAGKPAVEFTVANAGAGTAGAQQLPRQSCGLIYATTAKAGRAFRGRNYLPFPAAALQNATLDQPSAAAVAILGGVATILYGTFVVSVGGVLTTLTPIIFHRKANKAGTTVANGYDPILNFGGRLLWATQRRRGDYGRQNNSPI
jgi:hypothetical protein